MQEMREAHLPRAQEKMRILRIRGDGKAEALRMAEQKTYDKAAAGLNKKAVFALSLIIGILFGYKIASAYGLLTPFYLTALSALGTLGFWSASLVLVSIIDANRELNAEIPTLLKMQEKLNGLQEQGRLPKVPKDDRM